MRYALHFQVHRIKSLRGTRPQSVPLSPNSSFRERMSHAIFGQKGSDSGTVKQEHPVARLKVLLVGYTWPLLLVTITDTPHDA